MSHEILTAHRSELAEGPLWHDGHGKVYWVDIESGTLFSHEPDGSDTQVVHQGSKIGGLTIQDDGALILFRERGTIDLLRDGKITNLIEEIPDERESRFNDVGADPEGRVFCGTMPTPDRKGRLYRLDRDRSLHIVLENIGCSNGIGWTPDRSRMYYIDTEPRIVYSFDYDPTTGAIENQSAFHKVAGEGYPDGMTVDADGNLWIALWDGAAVIQVDQAGKEIKRIPLPARKITSPAFGGANLDQLYVTAAGGNLEDQGAGAGELMRLDVGVRGVPELRSRIEIP